MPILLQQTASTDGMHQFSSDMGHFQYLVLVRINSELSNRGINIRYPNTPHFLGG